MGIYLSNMEMPKSCAGCALYKFGCTMEGEYWNMCAANGKDPGNQFGMGVPVWCPLVPVLPHGDLIDRAKLLVEINKICDRRDAGIITDLTCLQQILSAVRHAPTIIKAEEERNDKQRSI